MGSTVVKVMVKFTLNRPRGPRGGVDVKLYSFFNLGARWGGWWPRPGRFTPGESPSTYRIGGWVVPKAGVDEYGKSLSVVRNPDRPARSESPLRSTVIELKTTKPRHRRRVVEVNNDPTCDALTATTNITVLRNMTPGT